MAVYLFEAGKLEVSKKNHQYTIITNECTLSKGWLAPHATFYEWESKTQTSLVIIIIHCLDRCIKI